ncbi:MAG: hypothetical protein ACQERN_07940 [Thermodesulfobacteriota bacterium]
MTEKPENPIPIGVDCYAGYRGEQEPRSVYFGKRTVEVTEILDRWIAPDHRYFKFRGDDGAIYIIRHDENDSRWELTFFENRKT